MNTNLVPTWDLPDHGLLLMDDNLSQAWQQVGNSLPNPIRYCSGTLLGPA